MRRWQDTALDRASFWICMAVTLIWAMRIPGPKQIFVDMPVWWYRRLHRVLFPRGRRGNRRARAATADAAAR